MITNNFHLPPKTQLCEAVVKSGKAMVEDGRRLLEPFPALNFTAGEAVKLSGLKLLTALSLKLAC